MSITEINTLNRSTTVTTPNNSSVVTTASRSTSVTPNRQAAIHTLAVVGFVALIGAAMWLAVYSTRYVPGVVNRIGSAAVYLGSVFTPAPGPSLSVVPTGTASTTIPFGTATTTSTTATITGTGENTSSTVGSGSGTRTPVDTTPTALHPVGGTAVAIPPYGLADLTVNTISTGYVTAFSQDSYVESATIPSGSYPAVKIRVKNIGTNWTGTWRLQASFPGTQILESDPQPSLPPTSSPDSYSDFILWSNGRINSNQNQSIVTVTVNFDSTVPESNTNNNTTTATLTVN